jgi:hypothetical protein
MDFANMIGRPFNWTTEAYGTIAVHVVGQSPNGAVALVTLDGGADSTPANRFPEMADGEYFAMPSALHKRPPTRTAKVAPERKPRGRAGEIRAQAEYGKRKLAEVKTGEVTF